MCALAKVTFALVSSISVIGCSSVHPPAAPPSTPPPPVIRTSQQIADGVAGLAAQDFGPEPADVATALRGFARVYQEQRKYSVAELLYQRVLAMQESTNAGSELENTLRELGMLYRVQRKWTDAEVVLERMVSISEKSNEPYNFRLAQKLEELANLYEQQQEYAKAEPILKRAIAIMQSSSRQSPMGQNLALVRLARLYQKQGRTTDADAAFQQAVAMTEKTNPPGRNLVPTLRMYASFLRENGRTDEAEKIESRAQELSKQLGIGQPASSADGEPEMRRIPFNRTQPAPP